MEQLIWIVIGIIWFVFSVINKNKKEQEKQKRTQQPLPPATETNEKKPQSFKEIFEEMRKQIQEVNEHPQEQPKPQPVFKPIERKQTFREISNKQIIIEDREMISEKEKQISLDYERYVAQKQDKEHAADKDHLGKKIQQMDDHKYYEPIEIDLKNILIADVILRRPEY